MRALTLAVAAATLAGAPVPMSGQTPGSPPPSDSASAIPSDASAFATDASAIASAFADERARTLVMETLLLRGRATEGLLSYESRVVERMRVGVAVTRRLPTRDRTLYHREQVADVRWESGGDHTLLWRGRREGQPSFGDDWEGVAPFGIRLRFDVAEELDLRSMGADLIFDPLGDRLDLFDGEFIQPVSHEGLSTYRFATGDSLVVRLQEPDRSITMVEVVVTPRSEAWETVEGSLWFDRDTGVLVRASYRPSGVWDHEVQEPGDLDDVPGFLLPGIGTVHHITIEYALYDQRWWLPRRLLGEGVFEWGHGLVRMPLTMEWRMSGYRLNAIADSMFGEAGNVRRAGTWRWGNDQRRNRARVLVPAGVDLANAPELPAPLGDRDDLAFSADELSPLLDRIEGVAGPDPLGRSPTLPRALLSALRYDRVRGLSFGYERVLPVGSAFTTVWARLGTAAPDWEAGLRVDLGPWSVAGYHRVDDASDWNAGAGLGNSVATLTAGHDGGDYYRSTGVSLGFLAEGRAWLRAEPFWEQHRPLNRETNFSLATARDDTLRANLVAERIDVGGLRVAVGGQIGSDPQRGVLAWMGRAEVVAGDADYRRVLASLRSVFPLSTTVSGAIEVSAGVASENLPVQRAFLIGGTRSLRGVRENALSGNGFWMLRAEVGYGLAGLRLAPFADLGWAGDRASFASGRPAASAGLGVSLVDGLLRADVARGFLRASDWRLRLYVDGLF